MPIQVRVFPLSQNWLPESDREPFFQGQFVPEDEPNRPPGHFRCPAPINSPSGSRVLFQNHEGFIIGDAVVSDDPVRDGRDGFFLRFDPATIRWFGRACAEDQVQSIWSKGWMQVGRGLDEQRGEELRLSLRHNRIRWYLDPDRLRDWDRLVAGQ